jgi:hypothetical protein
MKQDFVQSVKYRAEKAAADANNDDTAGDPDTHVIAYVDGRTGFVKCLGVKPRGIRLVPLVKDVKEYGDTKREGKYEIGPVFVYPRSDGCVLRIAALTGTDIQNHQKKTTLYRRFEEYMSEEGWNMSLRLDMYAY